MQIAVAWMVISPLAVITDIVGVVVCLHYKHNFHSCDVAFISIFVTMATSSALLFPVPAVIKLCDLPWNKHLCLFYTWLAIALRTSHLLVLLVLNVYWVASLRMSPQGRMFLSTKPMKATIGACWIVSVLAGLPPVAGGNDLFPVFQNNVCNFLPADVHFGYAVFFIILSLVSVIMGFISSLDTLMVLRSMRDAVTSRYQAAGIHAPTFSGVAGGRSPVHAEHNELNVSMELCRLVLCFSVASAAMDALPLLVSQFMELTSTLDLESLEVALLWLLLTESLTLPHVLWALSRRYRHAGAYTWRVFVLRDQGAVEADATSCTLQAFRTKVKDADEKRRVRSMQTNEAPPRPSIPELNSYIAEREDDAASTTNDSNQDDVDDSIKMTTTDIGLILSTQISPSEIVIHRNCGQDNIDIDSQGHSTSSSPRPQQITEGLTPGQSSVFAISDTRLNHTFTYASPYKTLTTFTYDSCQPVQTSTLRKQIKKSNNHNTAKNNDKLLNAALNGTGKDTVSQGNTDYSTTYLSKADGLDNTCIHNSILRNSCGNCHIMTQQSMIHDGSCDCLNTGLTDVLIQHISLTERTGEIGSDANRHNKLIGVSSNEQPLIIMPNWPLLEDFSRTKHINSMSVNAHHAQERQAICYARTSQAAPAIVNENQNAGNVQQKPYILMQKYTVVLGVYYDDTHAVDNELQGLS